MYVWFPSPFQDSRVNLFCRTNCRALTAAMAGPPATYILKKCLLLSCTVSAEGTEKSCRLLQVRPLLIQCCAVTGIACEQFYISNILVNYQNLCSVVIICVFVKNLIWFQNIKKKFKNVYVVNLQKTSIVGTQSSFYLLAVSDKRSRDHV